MRNLVPATLFAFVMLSHSCTAIAQTATQDVIISANVASFCTIDGVSTPSALNTTIPVTNGVVSTSLITITVADATCNGAADVQATSLSGGVTTGGAATSGTTNIINYTGVATFDGAISTINTASTGGAVGEEEGNVAPTSGAASGDIVITILPAQPLLPLMASTAYADTLQVTLTPH